MLLSPLLLIAQAAPQAEFEVPPGFVVERASERVGSFLALTFDAQGRMFVSLEGGPILWLADEDHDGRFEKDGTFSAEVESAQGMLWSGGVLYAVGNAHGTDGVYRLTPDAAGTAAAKVELFLPVVGANGDEPPGEHGAHGIVAGPDGFLYLMLGNYAKLGTEPDPDSPLRTGYEGSVLPPLDDPNGFGLHVRYPCGYVARIDPRTGAWRYVSVGLRNCYDLGFNAQGDLFTFDSDMEWDVGLPWYRPCRFLHLVEGGDYGSRAGSHPWPSYYFDSLPPLLEVGRGSPTGMVVYQGTMFPEKYCGALLAGDWSQGRILAVFLKPAGATYSGDVETLLQAKSGLNITDLEVGPGGAVYFVSGGRGTVGHIERLMVRTGSPSSPQKAERDKVEFRVQALREDCLRDLAGAFDVLARLVSDPDPILRRNAAYWLGRVLETRDRALGPLTTLMADVDPLVRRASCEAMMHLKDRLERQEAVIQVLRACLDADPWISYAARRVAERSVLEVSDWWWLPWKELTAADSPSLAQLWSMGREAMGRADNVLSGLRAGDEFTLVPLIDLRVVERGLEADPDGASARMRISDPNATALVRRFPDPDWRISRELALLIARQALPAAIPALMAALGGEHDREQQIHYAYCLSAIESGWTPEQARKLFAWFDESETWTGGLSFQGYLLAMRKRLESRFDAAAKIAMATSAPMGGRTIAHFMSGMTPDEVDRLAAPLAYAWIAAAEGRDAAAARAERAAILGDLGDARSPRLAAWLRKLVDATDAPQDEVVRALARCGEAQDWPILAHGLASADKATVAACAKALAAIDRKPDVPAPYRAALDAAQRLGSTTGMELLALVEHWGGEKLAPDVDWNAALAAQERWFKLRFPDFVADAGSAGGGPRWDFERTLAFLERSAARKGSPARGKLVYAKASCTTCHVIEGAGAGVQPTGWGPELSTVTKRFDTKSLLEAIWYPSRAISDQYRTTVFLTKDDERVEGRIVGERGGEVELLLNDGSRTKIPAAEIAERKLATISYMPEGLLGTLDLEDVKDLFAYLAAGGKVDAAEERAPPFEPMFAGKSRNNWDGDRALWELDADTLTGRAENLPANSYLVSKESYGDFELAFDVRITEGGNSGVQVRSSVVAGAPDPVGIQADIGQQYWGALYATDGRGLIAQAVPGWRDVLDPQGWNHYVVRCEGERCVVELNGLTTVDARDARYASGVLAFQLHQGLAMEVRFANARLRALAH